METTDILTQAQIKTINVILRNGGSVVACMGRLGSDRVNKVTLGALEAEGMVTIRGNYRSGPCRLDVTVTALGCQTLYAQDMANVLGIGQ